MPQIPQTPHPGPGGPGGYRGYGAPPGSGGGADAPPARDSRPVWQVVTATIGALGVIGAAVVTGVLAGRSSAKPTPTLVSLVPAAPAASAAPTQQNIQGWSFPGAYNVFYTGNRTTYIELAGLRSLSDTSQDDLSVSAGSAPGIITPLNHAVIVDAGLQMPSYSDCESKLKSPAASATDHSQEYYCVRTGVDDVYLLQEWAALLDPNNNLAQYDFTVWTPAQSG